MQASKQAVADESLLCPSANPDLAQLRVLGVVEHGVEGARVSFLDQPLAATPDVLALTAPLPPTAVLRLAGNCQTNRCPQFAANKCSLATRVVEMLPVVVDRVSKCQIRAECRWFRQEGIDACIRCPQIVTTNYNPSGQLRKVIHIRPVGRDDIAS
jgi:hypothetical protein